MYLHAIGPSDFAKYLRVALAVYHDESVRTAERAMHAAGNNTPVAASPFARVMTAAEVLDAAIAQGMAPNALAASQAAAAAFAAASATGAAAPAAGVSAGSSTATEAEATAAAIAEAAATEAEAAAAATEQNAAAAAVAEQDVDL